MVRDVVIYTPARLVLVIALTAAIFYGAPAGISDMPIAVALSWPGINRRCRWGSGCWALSPRHRGHRRGRRTPAGATASSSRPDCAARKTDRGAGRSGLGLRSGADFDLHQHHRIDHRHTGDHGGCLPDVAEHLTVRLAAARCPALTRYTRDRTTLGQFIAHLSQRGGDGPRRGPPGSDRRRPDVSPPRRCLRWSPRHGRSRRRPWPGNTMEASHGLLLEISLSAAIVVSSVCRSEHHQRGRCTISDHDQHGWSARCRATPGSAPGRPCRTGPIRGAQRQWRRQQASLHTTASRPSASGV